MAHERVLDVFFRARRLPEAGLPWRSRMFIPAVKQTRSWCSGRNLSLMLGGLCRAKSPSPENKSGGSRRSLRPRQPTSSAPDGRAFPCRSFRFPDHCRDGRKGPVLVAEQLVDWLLVARPTLRWKSPPWIHRVCGGALCTRPRLLALP